MLERAFTLPVDGIPIVGRLYLPDNSSDRQYPAVIICHGIPAQSQSPDESGYNLLGERVCGLGYAAVVFNFRGAGLSGGNFDLPGWVRDLRAVVGHVASQPEIDRNRIGLFGFSGGAAVSVCEAADDPRIAFVIAAACPADFPDFSDKRQARGAVMYFRKVGIIRDAGYPPDPEKWFDGFNAVRAVDRVAHLSPRKLLIIHGDKDETVPVEHAHRLYAGASAPKQLLIIPGAGHRLRHVAEAMNAIIHWLEDNLRTA